MSGRTQLNFQGGVNKKHSGSVAGKGEAEKGETTKAQENFNWTKEKCKESNASYPDTTPQMNFRNGA